MAENHTFRGYLFNAGIVGILIVIAVTTFSWLVGVVMLSDTGPGEFLRFAVSTPEAAGSVLGIVGGFAGVIVTTMFGFYFAIRQRKEDARLARRSREHQADIDRESRKDQARHDRERDAELREREAKALAAILHAELLAHLLVADHLFEALEKHFEGDGRDYLPSDYEAAILVWAMEFPVYRANLARLGILGANLEPDVVATIQRAETRMALTLHNLYQAGSRAGDGQKDIAAIFDIDREMREAAERLRVRAGVPPDKNSELVEEIKAEEQAQKSAEDGANDKSDEE
jgi:hypothetical protein